MKKRKQRLPPNSKQRDLLNHNNNSSSSNKSKNNKRSKYLCLTSGGGAAPSPRAHLQLPLFSISPADACARVQQQQQQRKPPLRQRRCARLYFLFDGPLYHHAVAGGSLRSPRGGGAAPSPAHPPAFLRCAPSPSCARARRHLPLRNCSCQMCVFPDLLCTLPRTHLQLSNVCVPGLRLRAPPHPLALS